MSGELLVGFGTTALALFLFVSVMEHHDRAIRFLAGAGTLLTVAVGALLVFVIRGVSS